MIDQLPKSWARVSLGEVLLSIVGGGTPSKKNPLYWNGDIPWFTVKDMHSRTPIDSIDHITSAGLDDSAATLIPADSVITATRIGLGKTIRLTYPAAINQDLKALITPAGLDKGYLEYWILANRSLIESQGKGTTVKGIRLETLRAFEFPLPPLAEQKRIVARIEELFSEIDNGVANLQRAKELLVTYRQSVLKAAFEGKSVQGLEVIEFEIVRLRDLADAVDPHPSHRTPPEVSDGIPYVSIRDLKPGEDTVDPSNARRVSRKVLAEHRDRYTLVEGDFIVGKIGTVGKVIRVPARRDITLSANVVLVQPDRARVLPRYLYWCIQSSPVQSQFLIGKRATSQAAFGIQKFRELQIPLCSIVDQERIVSIIDSSMSASDVAHQTITTSVAQASALRRTILEQAFSGQLVPQNPNDEPASSLLERIKAEKAAQKPATSRKKRKSA